MAAALEPVLQDVADPLRKAGSKLLHEHLALCVSKTPYVLASSVMPLESFQVHFIKLGCSHSEEFDVIECAILPVK